MKNIYKIRYCKEIIARFYANLRFTGFNRLTPERIEFINELVIKNRNYFLFDTDSYGGFVTSTAKKLHYEAELYDLRNGDEKAYFYLRMIDPTFQYLEIFESFYSEELIKDAALLNFGYYDKFIIYLEKLYNKKYKEFENLWERDSIKRVFKKKN